MLLISVTLTLSRELAEYELNDKKAIVASIARITITTISSTNVNQRKILGFREWFLTELYLI